jgi:hypothetical protein
VDEPLTYAAIVKEKVETGKYPRMCIKAGKVVRFTGAFKMPDPAKGRFTFASIGHFEHETETALPGLPGYADWEEAKANVAPYPERRSAQVFGEGVSEIKAARNSGGEALCEMDTEVTFYDFLSPNKDGTPPKHAIVYLTSQGKGPPYMYVNIEKGAPLSLHEGDITPRQGVLRRIIDRTVPPSTPLKVRPPGAPERKSQRKRKMRRAQRKRMTRRRR